MDCIGTCATTDCVILLIDITVDYSLTLLIKPLTVDLSQSSLQIWVDYMSEDDIINKRVSNIQIRNLTTHRIYQHPFIQYIVSGPKGSQVSDIHAGRKYS